MTLPFRRRHHDAEATHDRARALSSRRFLEPLDADEEAWLAHHLETCTECSREQDAFAADRELLRALRDKPIEPPRDLWVRTAAALDVAAGKRPAPAGADRTGRQRGVGARTWWRALPLGAVAGVAVLLVVVASALLPGLQPSGSQVANASVPPGPTAIAVQAAQIPALRSGANGSWDLFFTEVNKVCPRSSPECVPPPSQHEGSAVNLLGAKASTVTISPHNDQLVFEADSGAVDEGKIYVVPVAPPAPESQPPVTPPTSSGAANPPSETPPSAGPTPVPTPVGQIEIASGVTVVGDVAYSVDGQWLAFSAAPNDGSTGPDLYLYSVGSGMAAAVTSDHQTYFSAWLGGKVLASHVIPEIPPATPGNPKASDSPGASGQGNAGGGPPIQARASSFVLDPSTLERSELAQQDVWMPVVDRGNRYVAYWSGTLRSTNGGVTWQLGDGQLVLDGWNAEGATAPDSSAASGSSTEPASTAATAMGPAGHPSPLVSGHVEEFRAKFDPDGVRLAVWVGERAGDAIGRLHLAVIDPATGAIKGNEPLPGAPALRRFSIAANRLAWVSPSGQDGQESSLQVLGWQGDSFGQIESEPAADLQILN